ncbi:MAG: hemin uptake protein HemP [Ramlibacter sp.]|nr:hemin uptake protein HemP [Ramlibacter sp.]
MDPKREPNIVREHSFPAGRMPRGRTGSEPNAVRRLSSADLFAGDSQLEIEHQDVLYRLRVTSLGKLILTK